MSTSTNIVYQLVAWDYTIIAAVLGLSLAIGFYYAWQARKFKSARDFLVAKGSLGVLPLVASALATVVSPKLMLGYPNENYCNGIQMLLYHVSIMAISIFSSYIILPVLFRLNVDTVNQYIKYRFNRALQLTQTIIFLLQSSIMVASITSLTVRMISDATGLSYWTSMTIICGICAVYTSVGGFTGVVWTDFLQVVVIVITIVVFITKGTLNEGGVSHVWKKNAEGNRTVMFRMSPDNESNYSFWSLTIGGIAAGLGYSIDQSLIRRQLTNKTEAGAKATLQFTRLAIFSVQICFTWMGMLNYARYRDCDPVLNKQIHNRDQITILYAMDMFRENVGLKGLFIAGILSASLSTLSSMVNSFSMVVVVDILNPYFPKLKQKSIMILTKLSGLAYGGLVVGVTLLADQIGPVIQVSLVVSGATYGPSAGLFMLGFFYPWATTKGAISGFICALMLIWWCALGRLIHRIPYITLPLSTKGCNILNNTILNDVSYNFSKGIEGSSSVVASPIASNLTDNIVKATLNTNDIFFLYRINTMWYTTIAMTVVVVVGMVVSLITGPQDPEAINPRLISPFSWAILKRMPIGVRRVLGFRSERFQGDIRMTTIMEMYEESHRNMLDRNRNQEQDNNQRLVEKCSPEHVT